MSGSGEPASGASAPRFELRDGAGRTHAFQGGGPALICFVKEDCPTCNEVMPVLDAFAQAFGACMPVLVVGQDPAGNRLLESRHGVTFPILDDTELAVSFGWDVDIVPTLVEVKAAGPPRRLIGFVREEWQHLAEALSGETERPQPEVDWDALPAWRPGCGSASADPLVAERLRLRAAGSPLTARRIEIGAADEHEFLFEQGVTDGLPVVPPTPDRVLNMLRGTAREPGDLVAVVPPNMGDATVEKVAVNAVMAGCRPEYLPVVIAALEAVCTDAFNVHGVMATTMGASPVLVVNGPIRHRIGMNMKQGALGQGNRANATIGRALRLVLRNVGGARPGGTERSTLGNPMKFTLCFAEWEERSPWPALHVERGFAPEDSVVTAYAMTSGPVQIVDQTSRSASRLAGTFGLCLEAAFNPKAHYATDALVVVCPEHVDTLHREHYDKAALRQRIQAVTARPLRDLLEDEVSGGIRREAVDGLTTEELDRPRSKFRRDEDIHIVVAGAEAGKFSGAFHGWATGETGSQPVSRKIEEAS